MKVHIERKELKKAFEKQKKKAKWTFYNEREFLENLLQTRFNFLITVYAIFFGAFFLCEVKVAKIIIAVIAFVIILFMFITIYRIYIKVDALLSILYELDGKYTSKMIDKVLGRCSEFLPNVNRYIGFRIPLLLLISSVSGIIYSAIKIFCNR